VVFLARESCLKFCGFRHTVSKRPDRTWLPAVTGDVSPPRMFQEHVESFYRQQPSDHAMPIPPCLMLCRPFDLATAKRATPRRDQWCGGPGQQMRASRAEPGHHPSIGGRCRAAFSPSQSLHRRASRGCWVSCYSPPLPFLLQKATFSHHHLLRVLPDQRTAAPFHTSEAVPFRSLVSYYFFIF
jgi:(2Fe-2S) ferredoxin